MTFFDIYDCEPDYPDEEWLETPPANLRPIVLGVAGALLVICVAVGVALL